jgi:hypothetical protein
MKKYSFYLSSLLIIFIYILSCEKSTQNPEANKPPDTNILSYVVSSASETDSLGNETNNYKVTVYWLGSDVDGEITEFQYSTDGSTFQNTQQSQHDFIFDFSFASSNYSIWVKAVDNKGSIDPTPAVASIKRDFGGIETFITDGPVNGSEVASTVLFKVRAISETGTITHILWKLDSEINWNEVVSDSLGEADIYILNLTEETHIVYFAGKRDDGRFDDTPISISFIVKNEINDPQLIFYTYFRHNEVIFAHLNLTIRWGLDIVCPWPVFQKYSYSLNDSTFYDYSSSPLNSGWVLDRYYIIPADSVTAGYHTFYVKGLKTDSTIILRKISFSAIEYNPINGILLIDDFSWVPDGYIDDAHIDSMISSGFMNGYSFTEQNHYQSAVNAGDLSDYSSVVLYGDNNYLNTRNGELFAAYVSAGGNLLITGYKLDDLAPWFGIFGIYPAVFGYGVGNYGGMDGEVGTAYENWQIDLPVSYNERWYQRVYPDSTNTQTIFRVRGVDGDNRSCGVQADMPNGNVVIIIGQSLPFMDQTKQDTKDFGDYILGTEFDESKE